MSTGIDVLAILAGQQTMPTDPVRVKAVIDCAARAHLLASLFSHMRPHLGGKALDVAQNASIKAEADARMLAFEAERLQRIFHGTGMRIILLKGAAYVAAQHGFSVGRRVSDIDILVSENDLLAVEKALRGAGFIPHAHAQSVYDQNYYRNYMHELPPLVHKHRRTVIDVHHRLTPRTSRISVDTAAMVAASQPTAGGALYTLAPIDQFLHAALHGLYDNSFDTPLRTSFDLFSLWSVLSAADKADVFCRAAAIGLEVQAHGALDLLCRLGLVDRKSVPARKSVAGALAYARIQSGIGAVLAHGVFSVREHWLRMPMRLLIPHLARKLGLWLREKVQAGRQSHQ